MIHALTWPTKSMKISIELFNHSIGKWEKSSMSCDTSSRKKPIPFLVKGFMTCRETIASNTLT